MLPAQMYQEEPKINFAPVIKIFHDGNDQSHNVGQPSSNTNEDGNIIMPNESVTTNENNVNETQENSDAVDFSKPIIIKKD